MLSTTSTSRITSNPAYGITYNRPQSKNNELAKALGQLNHPYRDLEEIAIQVLTATTNWNETINEILRATTLLSENPSVNCLNPAVHLAFAEDGSTTLAQLLGAMARVLTRSSAHYFAPDKLLLTMEKEKYEQIFNYFVETGKKINSLLKAYRPDAQLIALPDITLNLPVVAIERAPQLPHGRCLSTKAVGPDALIGISSPLPTFLLNVNRLTSTLQNDVSQKLPDPLVALLRWLVAKAGEKIPGETTAKRLIITKNLKRLECCDLSEPQIPVWEFRHNKLMGPKGERIELSSSQLDGLNNFFEKTKLNDFIINYHVFVGEVDNDILHPGDIPTIVTRADQINRGEAALSLLGLHPDRLRFIFRQVQAISRRFKEYHRAKGICALQGLSNKEIEIALTAVNIKSSERWEHLKLF